MSEPNADVGMILVPTHKGRPSLLIIDLRTEAELDGQSRGWQPPAHIRAYSGRTNQYLECCCGRRYRVIPWYVQRRRKKLVLADSPKPGRVGPFYDAGAMVWSGKHQGCTTR